MAYKYPNYTQTPTLGKFHDNYTKPGFFLHYTNSNPPKETTIDSKAQ